MNTPTFSEKLDALPATVELLRDHDAGPMAAAIARGTCRHALVVGSGGSAISAEYFGRCRDSLGLGATTVQTPMQVVVDHHALTESDVWLFSAGADNPDAVAASQAALDRGARSVHLVTRSPDGSAAGIVRQGGGTVHTVPVADAKDGYLATHSLLATIVSTLLACDVVSRDPRGAAALLDEVTARLTDLRNPATRSRKASAFANLTRGDTLMVAHDPRLSPMSLLLDTSIWEASLCHVQSADFRNIAHGRHGWLYHREAETMILALTGTGTRTAWSAIDALLPSTLLRMEIDYGTCGRLDNALAVVDGLGVIEAIGAAVGIDPGKPGMGDFGRPIYEDRALAELAKTLPPNVRHKRAAMAKSDVPDAGGDPLHMIGSQRLELLASSDIGGAVFDYDGTIVTTAGRWSLPDRAIVEELVRLYRAGLLIGFATGRGGSAGEDLRKMLPPDMLPSVPIGYYNGGHLRTADIDIEKDPVEADPAIEKVAAWLTARDDLFSKKKFKHRGVQITVDMNDLLHPYRFAVDIADCAPFAEGRVRVMGSGHSYDIVPVSSSKLVVVEAIRAGLSPGSEVLCFGDSGSRSGNDHALLSCRFGVSVGEVCGAANGCWSLFGSRLTGPEALLRILRALLPSSSGKIRLHVGSLDLDS